MKKLLCYLREYGKECVLGPLFKLLEASFELLVPLVMASIIDVGVKNGDRPYVAKMAVILVALGLIGLVCAITAQYFAAKASVGFAANLRHALFAHIQKLGFADMDEAGSATLITRMTSDVNQVQNGVNLTLRLLLRSPLVVFGSMVMAFTIDWRLALIFAVLIPLLSVVVFGVMLWTMPRYKQVQADLDKVLNVTRENLTGVRVIRAFGREEDETARFRKENQALTSLQVFVGRVSALMNPVTYVLINLGTIVLIWAGGFRVESGGITQGQLVALINYMAQILVELIKLANLIINITKSLACANRVEAVLEIRPSLTSPNSAANGSPIHAPAGAVEFQNVSLRYRGAGDESLSHVSFAVRPGQTVGVIGGTGSGKSSLVNLIPRFYDATGGSVLVGGRDVRDWPLAELRGRIGVVPQRAALFTGTVRENLLWGRDNAGDGELWDALETAQAKEFIAAKAKGLEEPVSQGGRNFSGGQRQRLTIARALVRKPEILILDDSASALDFATDLKLRTAIRNLPENPTVFLVSQRAASIRHADLILVLDDGEIVGAGTHEELLKTCGVYREIYESQFKKEEGGGN